MSGKKMRFVIAALCAGLAFSFAPPAFAKVSAEEAAQLGKSLTPLGGEMKGNSEGTIPSWSGGITQPPAGYKKGDHHPDPFATDKPLFIITAANMGKYASKLTDGEKALLKKYSDYFIKVYPTRRSVSNPQYVYDATKQNALRTELDNGGNGVLNAAIGIPFPIPKSGIEVVWNHLLRFRGERIHMHIGTASPLQDGTYDLVMIDTDVKLTYSEKGATPESIGNRLSYFKQVIRFPARLAGNVVLVHDSINQVKEARKAWVYNPGQRRVRRAPNIEYDNPGTATDGLRTNDNYDLFNGAPDRYNWKLLGKKEIYVPYNSYQVHSDKLSYDDILKAGHVNSDLLRYELHRVWVVEGDLKEGVSHIYKKRVFYIDEDSWSILEADHYDQRGELWRVAENHHINYYEVPADAPTLDVYYDLQSGRYTVNGLDNKEEMYDFSITYPSDAFLPNALRRSGVR